MQRTHPQEILSTDLLPFTSTHNLFEIIAAIFLIEVLYHQIPNLALGESTANTRKKPNLSFTYIFDDNAIDMSYKKCLKIRKRIFLGKYPKT